MTAIARSFVGNTMFLDTGDGPRWHARPRVDVDAQGTIVAIDVRADSPAPAVPTYDFGSRPVLPGLVNAHSHAFQRVIRGRTGRRGEGDPSSFWSWREAMYRAAMQLDPDGFFAVTRACYAEMLRSGITCVGEFHYVHHQSDGRPYDDANELGHAAIAAAREVGLRLVLLDVYYRRAGHGRDALPEQRRFCDASVDHYLTRIEALRSRADGSWVTVGLAPHSVRAVPRPDLLPIAAYAHAHDLVVHAHVSEQTRENEECQAEHRSSPMQVFADTGCLATPRRFTAVHAIYVNEADQRLLASQNVCACPTTEADLGDGIVPASEFLHRGTTLCLGSDSNAVIDLVQEARLLEMGERLRRCERLCLADAEGHVAPVLLAAATQGGATALGRADLGRLAVGHPFDVVAIDRGHLSLRDVPDDQVLDALLLSGSAAAVAEVYVGGERRV